MKPITVMVDGPWTDELRRSLRRLVARGLVEEIDLRLPDDGSTPPEALIGVPIRAAVDPEPGSGPSARWRIDGARTPYLLQVQADGVVDPEPRGLMRLLAAARDSGAPLVYGDYADATAAGTTPHPLADYQLGSIGDRFALGPLRLWSRDVVVRALDSVGWPNSDLLRHGWYDVRLKASEEALPVRIPEPVAVVRPRDQRASGKAVFDYLLVQREAQQEAERVATAHLTRIGAVVTPPFAPYDAPGSFPVEASVVIPVRDRVKTVAEAVDSALAQETRFPFNVVVVDNHSTDGTTELLAERASADGRLVHLVPDRRDLGIGGCWNHAAFHPSCGRYAVQLDSDDLYSGTDVLARIVATLREGGCGMVIGSYSTVDFDLNPLPPGLIDHREWSDDNGPNNALRIDGLGAPRSFATELIRRYPLPNVSYGEDYALALRISRSFRVGRIYDSLYHCRRWEDNTDAALSADAVAKHQVYKDRIRTLEILARQKAAGEGAIE